MNSIVSFFKGLFKKEKPAIRIANITLSGRITYDMWDIINSENAKRHFAYLDSIDIGRIKD